MQSINLHSQGKGMLEEEARKKERKKRRDLPSKHWRFKHKALWSGSWKGCISHWMAQGPTQDCSQQAQQQLREAAWLGKGTRSFAHFAKASSRLCFITVKSQVRLCKVRAMCLILTADWPVSLSDMPCWLADQFIRHALLIGWSVYQTCPGHWPLLTARCPDLRLQTLSPLTIKEVIIVQFQHHLMMWDPSDHSCKNSNKRRGVLLLQIDKDSSAGRSSLTKNWIDQRHLR